MTQVEYITTIPHVREVMIAGTTDAEFWRARLQQANLYPFARDGKADLLISATHLKWMGMPASELVISVAACTNPDAQKTDGPFLIAAFNSVAWMAWMERTMFKTGYESAQIQIVNDVPARFTIHAPAHGIFNANMSGESRTMRREEQLWEGKIFLSAQHYFCAKLGGTTDLYPFVAGDKLDLDTTQDASVFRLLRDSNFVPREWGIRTDATHARSNTFNR